MRVVHWSKKNSSGMHRVAEQMARAEVAVGVDAKCLDPFDFESDPEATEWALDADVQVGHTHLPDFYRSKPYRQMVTKPWRAVFVVHGTPELIFEETIRDAEGNGYGSGRSQAGHIIGMQDADAIVTFWPRHRDLYDLATDKHTIVDCLPMAVDAAFWQAGVSAGKYAGDPSFFSCENQYAFKWAYEILRVWRLILREVPSAGLHITNVPTDQLRHVDALAMRYGSLQHAWVGSWRLDQLNLRNVFKSVDYYVSPVRYGDFNRTCLEASASGAKVISYPGNPYADFWMPEGDQRNVAKALVQIAKGEMEPRVKDAVPTEREMAQAAVHVYERILDRPQTKFALGEIPDALPLAFRDALLSATGAGLGELPKVGPRPKAKTADEIRAAFVSPTAPLVLMPKEVA